MVDLSNESFEATFASDFARARSLAQQVLEISERINFTTGRGMYERNIGTIAEAQGDIPAAMDRFYKAIELYKIDGYQEGVAAVTSDLGLIAYGAGDLKKAQRELTESRRIFQEINDSAGLGSCYVNLGLVLRALGSEDEFLASNIQAAKIFAALNDSLRLGIAYGNIAAANYVMNRMQVALDYRFRSLECFTTAKRPDKVRSVYAQIGETYRRLGNYDSARVYLNLGLASNLEANDKASLISVYEYLAKLDSTTGRYKEALYDKLMWVHYSDSVNAVTNNSEITRTEMRYEFREKEALAQQELDRERTIRNVMIGGVATLLAFTIVFFRQRNKVKREKARSEDLLLNILPAETAEELKATGTATARQYDQVTVLFTDFVNFTGIAESLTPTELVAEVHRIFTAIDAIIEKHGLEKIKTIGDAYLAVCGLPMPAEDHALRVVRAAKDIVDHMADHNSTFQIRIGINSGPVVAGIVGVKKFAYDIWGDTVNTASRMERASEPGRINLSEATYQLIKDHVSCEYRGMIDVKGKGAVGMYYVAG